MQLETELIQAFAPCEICLMSRRYTWYINGCSIMYIILLIILYNYIHFIYVGQYVYIVYSHIICLCIYIFICIYICVFYKLTH